MLTAGIAILVVLAVAVLFLLDKDSGRIFGESVRMSNSSAAALGCASGMTDDFAVRPIRFPANPKLVDPATLFVSVGEVRFSFESLTHRERPRGKDSWDFVFKPRDATDGLSFIFRQVPGTNAGYGYVIDGPSGTGLEPANMVCNLIDFHKGPMGEFLEDRSNDEGFDWAAGA